MVKYTVRSVLVAALASIGLFGAGIVHAEADAQVTQTSSSEVSAPSGSGDASQVSNSNSSVVEVNQSQSTTQSFSSTISSSDGGQVSGPPSGSDPTAGSSDQATVSGGAPSGGAPIVPSSIASLNGGGSTPSENGPSLSSPTPLQQITNQIRYYAQASQDTTVPLSSLPVASQTGTNKNSPAPPNSPLNALQRLTLALSAAFTTALLSGLANLASTGLHTANLNLALILLLATLGWVGSIFIRYLRASGYYGAARSSATTAATFFDTPLKMSSIRLYAHG